MQCLRQIKASPNSNTIQLCLFDGIQLFDPKVLNNIIFSVSRYDKYYIITTQDTVYFIYQENTANTTYLSENIIIYEDNIITYNSNKKLLFKKKEYIGYVLEHKKVNNFNIYLLMFNKVYITVD